MWFGREELAGRRTLLWSPVKDGSSSTLSQISSRLTSKRRGGRGKQAMAEQENMGGRSGWDWERSRIKVAFSEQQRQTRMPRGRASSTGALQNLEEKLGLAFTVYENVKRLKVSNVSRKL